MKKILSLSLAFCLIMALFAGCGGETTRDGATVTPTETGGTPETGTASNGTAEDSYFPLEETGILSYWFSYPPIFADYADGPQDYLVYIEAQERLNVELEWQTVSFMSAREQFNIMINSGDYTDMIYGMKNYYTYDLDVAIDEDIIIELTQLIEDYAPNYKAARESTDLLRKTSMTDSGNLPQFNYLNSFEGAVVDAGLLVRQDWLDELGVDSPVTYDDYYEFLKYTSVEYGAGLGLPSTGTFRNSLFASAFDIIAPFGNTGTLDGYYQVDGKVKYGAAEDGFLEYLTLMHQWYEEGLIMSDFETDPDSANSSYVDETRMANGDVSVWCGITKYISYYESMIGAELTPASNALLYEGQITHVNPALGAAAAGVVITTNCDDAELAVRFCDWFYSEEGFEICNYGLEGYTFNYTDDGGIEFTDVILNNPDGMSLNIALTLFTGGTTGAPFYFDNTKYQYLYNEKENLSGRLWTDSDDGAWSISYITLTADESNAVGSTVGDINTFMKENTLKFIMGIKSLDEFNGYIETMYSMGLQDVLDTYTNAYARYLAR